jgi:hypothetical protein
MDRRLVALVVGSVFVAGGLVPIGVAQAAHPRLVITAQGTVTCDGAAKAKFKPPLSNAPQSGTRTITAKFKWSCVGETGSPHVPVASARARMVMTAPASVTCNSFVASHQDWSTSFTIAWKSPGGKIDSSVATFGGAMVTTDPDLATMSGLTMFLPRVVNETTPDPTSVSGSWSETNNHYANLHVDGGFPLLTSACAKRNVKKLTLTANSFVLTTS